MGELTKEIEFYRLRKAEGDEDRAKSLESVEWARAVLSDLPRHYYLEHALELWPQNLDALVARLEGVPLSSRFIYLEALVKEHAPTYLKGPSLTYANLAQRPYLRLLHELAATYAGMGRYHLAAGLYDLLLQAGLLECFEFKRELLMVYYHTGDWEGLAQVYPHFEEDEIHEVILLPCLLLAYQTDHLLWVDYFWQELDRLNSGLDEFFSQETWPIEDIIDQPMGTGKLVSYLTKHDYQTLILAANPILPSLLNDDYSYHYFRDKLQADQGPSLSLADLAEDQNLVEALASYCWEHGGSDEDQSYWDLVDSQVSLEVQQKRESDLETWQLKQAVGEKRYALLAEAGYGTCEDLAQAAASDLLTIKGIGLGTIDRLREMGLDI